MKVKFKKVNDLARLERGTDMAAGYDIVATKFVKFYSNENEDLDKECFLQNENIDTVIIEPGARVLISTGIKLVELDPDYEIQVRGRSGLGLKKGLVVANSPGTIDADYRGEIGVILLNTSYSCVEVQKGDRIAQLVFKKVEHAEIIFTDETGTKTKRNEGGYGSTGN